MSILSKKKGFSCFLAFLLAAPDFIEGAEWFPAGPGMLWIYRHQVDDADPTTVTVEMDEARGGGMFHLQSTDGGEGSWVQVEGERVFSVVEGPFGTLRSLLLDFSLPAGASWEIFCEGTVTVVETGAAVTVPAGAFVDCVVFRTEILRLPGVPGG